MSIDDLRSAIDNFHVREEPNPFKEESTYQELANNGRDMESIVVQKDIEKRFNNPFPFRGGSGFFSGPITFLKRTEEEIEEQREFNEVAGRNVMFALGYPSRLIRSMLAITGVSALSDRFGDIRRSQNFWAAMMDMSHTLVTPGSVVPKVLREATEQTKQIPSLLTDPSTPETALPGFGNIAEDVLDINERHSWIVDTFAELALEANIGGAVKRTAKQAWKKFIDKSYSPGKEIIKRKGISKLLGQMTDDEIKAMDEAVKFRQVGKLGTKPPNVEIESALNRTFDYIKSTGDARLTKQEFISAQRRVAASKMNAAVRRADKTGEYGPGLAARIRSAGRTEKAEKAFKPFLETSEQAAGDLTTLNKVIANHDFGGKIFTEENAYESLAKLYEYGELLTKGEVELLRDVFGNNLANSLGKFTVKATGIAGKTAEGASKLIRGLAGTSRILMTTGELSFLLRQGNFRAWSRPKDAVRSFFVAGRALVSPKYARQMDDAMRFSRVGKIGTEHGLFLGRFGREVGVLTAREEFFMSEWLHKVPVIGKAIEGFERGYVSGLNQIRIDWFDEGLQLLENAGKAGDDDLVKKWATYVNNMTGRADIDNIADANKALKAMAEIGKNTLFAPRFAASKWNRYKVAADIAFGKNTPNVMRRMLATDTLLKWRRYERFAHYATQNGFEIENNPLSSDYLKVKAKGSDTRFDILGGDAQIHVLLARIVTGKSKDAQTKLMKDRAASDIASQYVSGKLNPMWSLILDKMLGRTFTGEDIDDPKVVAKVIRNKFIPLYLQDITDKIVFSYEEEGKTVAESIESSIPTIGMGFVGAGVQTFKPSARKEYELMINDKAQALYDKDFEDLPVYLKEEVIWEAEWDDIDKTDLLKEEMGMFRATRSTAARMAKESNKSFRAIRNGLKKDYKIFADSNISVREFPKTVKDVRLSSEQHDRLQKIYINKLKDELEFNADIKELPPKDLDRREILQDIVDIARKEAWEDFVDSEE